MTPFSRPRVDRHARFTLIELLVVIAIIAMLAALLMPALSKARYRAKNLICVNNLKSVGAAVLMYSSDYDEFYPTDRSEITRMGHNPTGIYNGNSSKGYDMRTPMLSYFSGTLKGIWQCPLAGPAYDKGAVYGDNYGRGTPTSIDIDTYTGKNPILTTYASYFGREAHPTRAYNSLMPPGGNGDDGYQGQVRLIKTAMKKPGDKLQFYFVNSQTAFEDNEYSLLAMDSFYLMKNNYSWIHRNLTAVPDPDSERSRYFASKYPYRVDINFVTDDGAVTMVNGGNPLDPNTFLMTYREDYYGWYIPAASAY